MAIRITKDESGIKFYGSNEEPLITIYRGASTAAIIRSDVIETSTDAIALSQAIALTGVFLTALEAPETKFKKNFIDTMYINEVDLSAYDTKYSPRKILRWMETGKIVTVNTKKRTKHEFTQFAYENNKVIIFYKPVVW